MTEDRLQVMLNNRRRLGKLQDCRSNWGDAEYMQKLVLQIARKGYCEDAAIESACAAPIERMRLSVLDKIDAEIAALEREFEQF